MTTRPDRSRRSLRTRLLVAFVVPLVVVLALVGVVSVTALRQELVSQVDGRLEDVTFRSQNYDEQPGYDSPQAPPADAADPDGPGGPGAGEPAFLYARGQGEGTLGAKVEDGVCTAAGVLGARFTVTALTPAQQAVVADLPAGGEPHTRDLGGELGEYRLVATTVQDGNVLVSGLP